MVTLRASRSFSALKHAQGQWDTTLSKSRGGLMRCALNFASRKRNGVDTLALQTIDPQWVFDVGAGKGAYTHWFLGRTLSTVVAIDWSINALRLIEAPLQGRVLAVCADIRFLPFKSNVADALFSIDALGHVDDCDAVLDEILRVCKYSHPLFIHSECNDYRSRWPDKALIKKLGRDIPAELDGHLFLHSATELYTRYCRRFHVALFINPAGYLGWFLGYPEKYLPAFVAADWKLLARVLALFSLLKKLPVIGKIIRLFNALTNHGEVYFGLKGGGSCFAMLFTPDQDTLDFQDKNG